MHAVLLSHFSLSGRITRGGSEKSKSFNSRQNWNLFHWELFFFLFFLSAVHLRAYSKRLSGLRVSTQHTLSFHLWKESTRHRRLRCVRSYRRLSNLSNLSVFCRSSRLLNTIKYLICPCDANILANMVITQKSCTVGMIMIMLIC